MTGGGSFFDLPPELFPFTVHFITQTGDTVHAITVTGPGACPVPALAEQHGPISVRIEYADGTADVAGPSQAEVMTTWRRCDD